MHHHLFPSEDTYITNFSNYEDKNFGITEILRIGTNNKYIKTLESSKDYTYSNIIWSNYCATNFSGSMTGSFTGSASASGVIDGTPFVGVTASLNKFTGSIWDASGRFTGIVTGVDSRNINWWKTTSTKFIDRSIIKFDINSISASIASGEIQSPEFKLNLKVCNEYDLPISYKIYAFPISQSWIMGNGYFSDQGSNNGVSWFYRDQSNGSEWYTPITTSVRPVVDFLNNSLNATGSFAYGGGTWYYDAFSTQSFSYESADICMDVTPIVNKWLDGTLPNEGLILISSDEIINSGSGFSLSFYSKDTNTIYSPYLDVMWDDSTWNSGSVGVSHITITSSYSGLDVKIQSGSSVSISGGINGEFSSSLFITNIILSDYYTSSFTGIVLGKGLSGNIINLPIIGTISGSLENSSSWITGSCGKTFQAQNITASFTAGIWSGSYLTAYYVDGNIKIAQLSGSWNSDAILGSQVNIPLPSGIEPYSYAYVTGEFVSGKAFGLYVTESSTSASFSGKFIEGSLIGGTLFLQLSGSITTSSYTYTSSINYTSSICNPVDTSRPFTVIIKNLKSEYKSGDIAKISVFARKAIPTKTFEKTTQQLAYIIPELLPSSSFYAIKDDLSEEIIVDFDNYTKISADYPEGNFFMIDTTGLAQERPYRILVKVQDNTSIYTFDNNDVFKITR